METGAANGSVPSAESGRLRFRRGGGGEGRGLWSGGEEDNTHARQGRMIRNGWSLRFSGFPFFFLSAGV